MVPAAEIVHRTPNRLRLSIPMLKGNASYGARLGEALAEYPGIDKVRIDLITASVLVQGLTLDPPGLAEFGRSRELFNLERSHGPRSLAEQATRPVRSLSRQVRQLTGGDLDLPEMAFLTLLGVGIVQALRGNLPIPPWYTAFWYAFGIFSKTLMDRYSKSDLAPAQAQETTAGATDRPAVASNTKSPTEVPAPAAPLPPMVVAQKVSTPL